MDAGLRVAVLSRVREVVAEREAALKQQMSSRELELQVRQTVMGHRWNQEGGGNGRTVNTWSDRSEMGLQAGGHPAGCDACVFIFRFRFICSASLVFVFGVQDDRLTSLPKSHSLSCCPKGLAEPRMMACLGRKRPITGQIQ